MRGVYECTHQITSLAAAKTVMYVTNAADIAVELLSAEISNVDQETNEQLEACLERVTTLGTPTATSVTPAPTEEGDQASVVTAKADVTASEPTYSGKQFGRRGFASLAGWEWPGPGGVEERVYVKGQKTIGLRLLSTPGTAFKANVKMTFREIG